MNPKSYIAALLAVIMLLALPLTACDTANGGGNGTGDGTSAPDTATGSVRLTFSGQSYTSTDDSAVTASGSSLVIVKAGKYELYGTLDDGQIIVRVAKTEEVRLIFCGFDISCSQSAPIYVESADKVTIELASGSSNTVTDAASYVYPSAEVTSPNAAIYSADDLTFTGTGSLTVTAKYNNGIGTKNDLRIKDGSITVSAPNNALKGNDSVEISGGTITVTGADDAIKSDSTDTGKGYILIEGGTLNITCTDDALQALTSVRVSAGSITVDAGGKAVNCDGTVSLTEGCLVEK